MRLKRRMGWPQNNGTRTGQRFNASRWHGSIEFNHAY